MHAMNSIHQYYCGILILLSTHSATTCLLAFFAEYDEHLSHSLHLQTKSPFTQSSTDTVVNYALPASFVCLRNNSIVFDKLIY